jgi:hypothetical protein
VDLIFNRLIPRMKLDQLWELLEYLSDHVYSRLSAEYEVSIRRIELAVLQYYLVTAATAGNKAALQTFFEPHGANLLASPDAVSWQSWFALPFISDPSRHEKLKVCP